MCLVLRTCSFDFEFCLFVLMFSLVVLVWVVYCCYLRRLGCCLVYICLVLAFVLLYCGICVYFDCVLLKWCCII